MSQFKISNRTNSDIGSDHWFNTLVSSQKAIAEILKTNTPTKKQLKAMAESLYQTTEELIEGWQMVQNPDRNNNVS
jgi:hypothetical protein